MIENRRYYRLPSYSRFILGNDKKVYSGKSTNVSFGGAFVQILDVQGIKSGDRMKCDFMLQENGTVLSALAHVTRVSLGSPNPTDVSGVGVEFRDYVGDSKRQLEEFVLDQKRLYEVLGALLMNTEPDLRSMKPIISKLAVPQFGDLHDLKLFVETTLRAVQMVEQRGV